MRYERFRREGGASSAFACHVDRYRGIKKVKAQIMKYALHANVKKSVVVCSTVSRDLCFATHTPTHIQPFLLLLPGSSTMVKPVLSRSGVV